MSWIVIGHGDSQRRACGATCPEGTRQSLMEIIWRLSSTSDRAKPVSPTRSFETAYPGLASEYCL